MKIYYTFLILFSLLNLRSQNFQGKITYTNTFESKIKNMTPEKFAQFIGSKQEYFIKEGDYLILSNGEISNVMLYQNKKNKIYTKNIYNDTIICFDASIEKTKVIEFKIVDSEEKILNQTCKKITMQLENGTSYVHYFAVKYKLNSTLFKGHGFNHWYFYLEKTNALPLKTIMENKQFKMISTAIEIKELKLSDSKFILPKDATIKCN